jgi:outer membrane lipoprotein-sorting protein
VAHTRLRRLALAGCLLGALSSGAAAAPSEEPGAREIVDRVEVLLWGRTVRGDYEMTISTPRWQRTLQLRAWMERPKRSFIRILEPAKEKGIGSLRIGAEMWNYLPNVERTIKIPPSMMLQPWMGSDLTNDDLVKSSSLIDDYTQEILREETVAGASAYVLELLPKPDAAVVWGRIVYWVRKGDFMPLKEEFYSERGELVRTMTFSDVKNIGGRTIPTRWELRPADKPGNTTTFVIKSASYDEPIADEIFTQRNLQKP